MLWHHDLMTYDAWRRNEVSNCCYLLSYCLITSQPTDVRIGYYTCSLDLCRILLLSFFSLLPSCSLPFLISFFLPLLLPFHSFPSSVPYVLYVKSILAMSACAEMSVEHACAEIEHHVKRAAASSNRPIVNSPSRVRSATRLSGLRLYCS